MTSKIPVTCLEEEAMMHSISSIHSTAPRIVDVRSYQKSINYLFLEILDEVLVDLLSISVKDAFYDHLESHYYMTRDEIPSRMNDVLLILERTFGKSGKTIQRTIARRLSAKLEQPSSQTRP